MTLTVLPMPMAGSRNLLVHEYAGIDRRRVHAALKIDLADFDVFIKVPGELL